MKSFISTICGLFICISFVSGQDGVAINESGALPHSSAILDVSSVDKGVLIPMMTELQRDDITSPATGLLIYQTDGIRGFYYYNGTSWALVGNKAFSIGNLADGSTAGNSVYLGPAAGDNDDGTDNQNVAVGYEAMMNNEAGNCNTALGYQSLHSNVNGIYNTSVGYMAQFSNVDGDRNCIFGYKAGYYNTGSYNTVLGYYANYYNQTGNYNTIIGYQAGRGPASQSKSGSVFIGYQAGFNETGSNKLYIENSSSSDPLIYGDFDTDTVRVNGTFDINHAFTFPTADGTSGQVFKTDGNGAVTWSDDSGATEINGLTDGIFFGTSLYLGEDAGVNDDGSTNDNVGIGMEALHSNVTGYHNTAVGHRALYNNLTHNNTSVGYLSLFDNQDGLYNTALGYMALTNNTEDDNTATGSASLYYNTGGARNTASGRNSLYRNTTGNNNVGLGYFANYYNQEGSNNTMIGYQAGRGSALHDKSGNIFIGYNAGYYEMTDNKLYIENSSSSSPLIYGEFDNDLLRVNGTLHIGSAYHFPTGDGTSGQVLTTDGSGTVAWSTVGSGGGATQLNDLIDAKTGGNSVFLGSDAGAADDGTDNRNNASGIAALNAMTTGNYNSAFGYRSLYHNIDGNYNITLGSFAGYRDEGGSQNVLIGYQAGSSIWTHSKSGNVHLGYQAGYNDTTDNKLYIENSTSGSPLIWGDFANDSVRINGVLEVTGDFITNIGIDDLYDGITVGKSVFLGENAGDADDGTDNLNTALGYHAFMNGNGTGNVAIGHEASENNATGDYNTEIGCFANANNTGGSQNTIIGWAAGYDFSTHSKSRCVMIGYAAGYETTASDRLYIESSSSSTPLIYGEFDNDLVRINGDFEVTGSLSGTIGIDGLSDGISDTYNVYLGYNAGVNDEGIHANTGVGRSALHNNISGPYNTALGHWALFDNTTGGYNTAIGAHAMENVTTSDNVAVGYEALYSYVGTGNNNTAVGTRALKDNTNGSNNIAVGYWALKNNFDGNDNTAVGYEALTSNSTGDGNTAFGYQSLYSNTGNSNTAVGSIALYNNTGYSNCAVGWQSMYSNTTGYENISIGAATLFNNTTGSRNVVIGTEAFSYHYDGDSNVVIGYTAGRDNHHGRGNIFLGYQAGHNEEGDFKLYIESSSSSSPLIWGDFENDRIVIDGNSTHNSNNRTFFSNGSAGGTTAWYNDSDERQKKNIKTIPSSLEKVMHLRGVNYEWIDSENHTDGLQMGFIAQEVVDIIPEVVDNKGDTYSMQYAPITALLVEAVKEQQELIEELRHEIEELKSATHQDRANGSY